MKTLHDAVAVVTGAASGIGRSLALQLAARGARVAVVDIQPDRAATVADTITQAGGMARAYAGDVADAAQMTALAATIATDLGGVDLLFNNAGVATFGTIEATRATDAQWLFSVNVMGVMNGIQAFLPLLKASASQGRPAHIVNTGSENSVGLPALGPTSFYTATKHAVLGLSDALRRDLEGTGIGVSILCPGFVATDIMDAKRNRPERFGGPRHLDPERARQLRDAVDAVPQHPDITARLCLDAFERGDFIIIADPIIRTFAERRHREVEAALDVVDAALPLLSSNPTGAAPHPAISGANS